MNGKKLHLKKFIIAIDSALISLHNNIFITGGKNK